jgi:hypothetical protein
MEIRPNKRWLQERRKELLAATDASDIFGERGTRQLELAAIDTAIGAMRTPKGAAAFRKQLKASARAKSDPPVL